MSEDAKVVILLLFFSAAIVTIGHCGEASVLGSAAVSAPSLGTIAPKEGRSDGRLLYLSDCVFCRLLSWLPEREE